MRHGTAPEAEHPWADQRFRKSQRLRKRREFLVVQRTGRRHYAGLFIALWIPGQQVWTRLGITASRKLGNAVARNRAKRLLREAFRRNAVRLPTGLDLVIIALPKLVEASYQDVERGLLRWGEHVRNPSRKRRK